MNKNWMYSIIERMFYENYVEDKDLENISEKDLDKTIKKVYDLLTDDGDLEYEIANLIEENAEWYYYHIVKKEGENDERL